MGDEATKVIINASGSREGLSKEMSSFLDFLLGKGATSNFTRKLQEIANTPIEKKKWKADYMTLI